MATANEGVPTNGQPAASYLYCPTGNEVSTTGGSVATGNPFLMDGAFYDSETQSYWLDGQQFDANIPAAKRVANLLLIVICSSSCSNRMVAVAALLCGLLRAAGLDGRERHATRRTRPETVRRRRAPRTVAQTPSQGAPTRSGDLSGARLVTKRH